MYGVNNYIWKYHKSMIYLKALPIWRMYYIVKYAIIQYNIKLVLILGVAPWCITLIVKTFIINFMKEISIY
jgi:hypothetical protein